MLLYELCGRISGQCLDGLCVFEKNVFSLTWGIGYICSFVMLNLLVKLKKSVVSVKFLSITV